MTRCPDCGHALQWDVQRAFHAEIPTVFLLTKCWVCDPKGEMRRQVLDVIWPPPGKPPDQLPPIEMEG